jgi:hypothetical protein
MTTTTYEVVCYASDGRPVRPVVESVCDSLEAARALVDARIAADAEPQAFGPWTEAAYGGTWNRECRTYGFQVDPQP